MKNKQLQKMSIEIYKKAIYKYWHSSRGKQSFTPMTDKQVHALSTLFQEIHALINEYIEPNYPIFLPAKRLSIGQVGKYIQALRLYQAALEVIGPCSTKENVFNRLEEEELDFYKINRLSSILEFLPDLTEELCSKYLAYKKQKSNPVALF